MGRRKKAETLRRYDEEDLAALVLLLGHDLDNLVTRIKQAMRRTDLVRPVLEPALDLLEELRRLLAQIEDTRRRLDG